VLGIGSGGLLVSVSGGLLYPACEAESRRRLFDPWRGCAYRPIVVLFRDKIRCRSDAASTIRAMGRVHRHAPHHQPTRRGRSKVPPPPRHEDCRPGTDAVEKKDVSTRCLGAAPIVVPVRGGPWPVALRRRTGHPDPVHARKGFRVLPLRALHRCGRRAGRRKSAPSMRRRPRILLSRATSNGPHVPSTSSARISRTAKRTLPSRSRGRPAEHQSNGRRTVRRHADGQMLGFRAFVNIVIARSRDPTWRCTSG